VCAGTPEMARLSSKNIARSLFSLQINPLAGAANVKNPGEIRYNGTLRASAAVDRTRQRSPSPLHRKSRTRSQQGACGS
jgi:hypothetical protein